MSTQNNTGVIVMPNGKRIKKINGLWHLVSADSVRAGRLDEWSQASEAYAEWLEEKYGSQQSGALDFPAMPADRDLILAYGTYEQFQVIESCWKAFNDEYPHVLGTINDKLDPLMLPMEPSMKNSKEEIRSGDCKSPDQPILHPPIVPVSRQIGQGVSAGSDGGDECEGLRKVLGVAALAAMALGIAIGLFVGTLLSHAGYFR